MNVERELTDENEEECNVIRNPLDRNNIGERKKG